jgi:hypothetical protein
MDARGTGQVPVAVTMRDIPWDVSAVLALFNGLALPKSVQLIPLNFSVPSPFWSPADICFRFILLVSCQNISTNFVHSLDF